MNPWGKLRSLYRAPVPALIAVSIVFIWQGIGHTIMVLMQRWFVGSVFEAAFAVGAAGAILVWIGRNKPENTATLLGFVGGSLMWLAWVEFSFVAVAEHLGIQGEMVGAKITKPEYLIMPSSIGVMFATLLFFYSNKETRCNAFMWLHRNLGMKPGEKTTGQGRNIAALVAMETIYITWFFYLYLLLIYDDSIIGIHHWFTYVSVGFFIVWTLYLVQRLWWYQRMAPALRYAIPTGLIGWNVVEILEKIGTITEFWVHPEKYTRELTLIGAALLVTVVLAIVSPARRKVERPLTDQVSAL
jgi:hypothetical protein